MEWERQCVLIHLFSLRASSDCGTRSQALDDSVTWAVAFDTWGRTAVCSLPFLIWTSEPFLRLRDKETEADELRPSCPDWADDIKGQRTRMKTTCRVSVDTQKNAISTFAHHSTHGLPPPIRESPLQLFSLTSSPLRPELTLLQAVVIWHRQSLRRGSENWQKREDTSFPVKGAISCPKTDRF